MTMNPEVQTLWADSLESGRFNQVRGLLTKLTETGEVEGHCCLGVLCELAVEAGVTISKDAVHAGRRFYGGTLDAGILPHEVRIWAGLPESNPTVNRSALRRVKPNHTWGGDVISFAECNDHQRLDFTQIARLVREAL